MKQLWAFRGHCQCPSEIALTHCSVNIYFGWRDEYLYGGEIRVIMSLKLYYYLKIRLKFETRRTEPRGALGLDNVNFSNSEHRATDFQGPVLRNEKISHAAMRDHSLNVNFIEY